MGQTLFIPQKIMTKSMSALSSMVVTIKTLLQSARERVIQSVNTTMVQTYFEIGRIIVEHEQQGSERAEYDAQTLKQVSSGLVEEFGRGFSVTNLQQMRVFYLVYQKQQTVSAKSCLLYTSPSPRD